MIEAFNQSGVIIIIYLLLILIAGISLLSILIKYNKGWIFFATVFPLWLIKDGFRIQITPSLSMDLSMVFIILVGISLFVGTSMGKIKIPNNIKNIPLLRILFVWHAFSLFYGFLFYGPSPWGIKILISIAFGMFACILMAITIKDIILVKKMVILTLIASAFLLIILNYRYIFIYKAYFLGNEIFGNNYFTLAHKESGKYQLGLYLAVFTPMAISYAAHNRKWYNFLIMLIFIFSTLYNMSRGVIISVAFSTLVLSIISSKKKNYRNIIISVPTLFVFLFVIFAIKSGVLLLLLNAFFVEFQLLMDFEGASINDRVLFIKAGYQSFINHPLIGIGLGNFRQLYIPTYGNHMISHNDYIQVMVEQGIIGLFIFIAFLFSVVFKIYGKLKYISLQFLWLYEAIFGSIISIVVLFFVLNFYDTLPVWYAIAISGILINIKDLEFNS